MAHFGRDDSFSAARTVQITGSETNENFTSYTIAVTVGSFTWTVKHRYSEFHELHDKLVSSHKVDKGLLPPKKLFGNQTESFVRRRQQDLQLYLQTVLNLLALRPPPALTSFLHFNLYEIHGITQTMAEDLYNRGELLLHSDEVFRVTPLQLHSLTERLKLPEPTCDSGDVRKDLGHILDFITRTRHLQVCGSGEWVGTSNINMNLLPFDLSLFKSLHTLEVVTGRFDMVQGVETVKQTLNVLKVYRTATTIKEVVLQDVPQWKGEDGSQLVGGWDHLTHVDLSHNFIRHMDSSVQIMWRVEHLDLSHNEVEGVEHLQWLSHLTWLSLAHNRLASLEALHTKLGNLKCLLLPGNHIQSLHGFSKLFSLEMLDVSDNKIAKVDDVRPVCQLPCMESLKLTGNSVILTVDYRTRILEMFGDRVGEPEADKEQHDSDGQLSHTHFGDVWRQEWESQKEKDTVAVRQALQKARDAKSRQPAPRKTSSTASFSDVCGGRGEREATPPPTRHSPLPSSRRASGYSSSVVGQGPRADNFSQMSSSAPHHPQPWPHTSMPSSIFVPGRSSPGQTSASSRSSGGQELWVEGGVDPPSPIPEAHPFDPSSDPIPSPLTKRKEYDIADLPSVACQDFVGWLQKHIPTDNDNTLPLTLPPSLPLDSTSGASSHCASLFRPSPAAVVVAGGVAVVVEVMWCHAQLYSTPETVFPCCAVLTNSKLVLHRLFSGGGSSSSWAGFSPGSPSGFPDQSVAGFQGFPGCPGLRGCVGLPLGAVQHVVVGPGYGYLRVEEAFVGRGGLFTLFPADSEASRRFAEALQDCCTQLDPSHPLEVMDLLGHSDLLTQLRAREKERGREAAGGAGVVSDYLAFTLLVRVRGREGGGGGGEEDQLCLLVMSESVVYLLDAGCVYWPPATFLSAGDGGGGSSLELRVLEEASIASDVDDLSLQSPGAHSEGGPRGGEAQGGVEFSALPLTLHLQQAAAQGPRALTLMFTAATAREVFVERLNNLRARHGQRGTPPTLGVPDIGASDLADSSFQSCRSRCSSPVVVCNGNGEVSDGSRHQHESSVEVVSPSLPVSSLRDQSQSTVGSADFEAARCVEVYDVLADPDSPHLSVACGGWGDRREWDTRVSVEAQVHSPHALLLSVTSDVHSADAINTTGAVSVAEEPCDAIKAEVVGVEEEPCDAVNRAVSVEEEPCDAVNRAGAVGIDKEPCSGGKPTPQSDHEEDLEHYSGLCPEGKEALLNNSAEVSKEVLGMAQQESCSADVASHTGSKEVSGEVPVMAQRESCSGYNKACHSDCEEQRPARQEVRGGHSGDSVVVSANGENCSADSGERSGDSDSEDSPGACSEKHGYQAYCEDSPEDCGERTRNDKGVRSECPEDCEANSKNNGAHSEEAGEEVSRDCDELVTAANCDRHSGNNEECLGDGQKICLGDA